MPTAEREAEVVANPTRDKIPKITAEAVPNICFIPRGRVLSLKLLELLNPPFGPLTLIEVK